MRQVLCTAPGRYGDILWSLAAVQELWRREKPDITFAVMPKWEKILPFVGQQPYINRIIAPPTWKEQHSHCGSQPWKPPLGTHNFDAVYHFGYRAHPEVQLIDYPATIHPELKVTESAIPFLYVGTPLPSPKTIPYHFSYHQHGAPGFMREIKKRFPGYEFIDTDSLSFWDAARAIARAPMFLGSRSSCYVIAQGLGRPCLIYEKAGYRRHMIYGCTYGTQIMPSHLDPTTFEKVMRGWLCQS